MNSALGITQNKKGRQQRMKLTIFGDRRYRSAPPRAGRRRRPRPHSSRTEPEEALRTGAPRHRRPGGPGGDRVGGRRSRRGALPPRSAVGARDGDRDPGNPGLSFRRCRQRTYGAWSLSAPHRSPPCPRLAARSRRGTTRARDTSCGTTCIHLSTTGDLPPCQPTG
jgi:hypothetical protein